ncbi:MAG: hypothetical protein GQ583_08180 [Methyloprofundus sp.]|nr:hypothetical protein [Methyloprofundus sp.]
MGKLSWKIYGKESVVHNLTKTLAAISLLTPLTAHSLGVGDIKLYSALNQKLSAEIALSLAADEELADIKVTLATPDKFDKLGIPWSYFLSRVRFQPVVKENGRVVIKLTSDEVVQEPFLDFLVEVSWPKGDIYKEFTVLVDPPAVYQQRRIEAPTISSTSNLIYSSPGAATAQNNVSYSAVDGEYGPTGRNDSLWKVAEKVNRHSDVSVEQVMMALYRANPGAFYKKNVNALMAGKILKIPDRAEILSLSKKQANTQFYRQMAVWKGKAVSEPDVQQADSEDNSKQLTLIPPTVDDAASSDALTANTAGQDSLVAENQQLQERLANLEKQFALIQEMMVIKDQQLAVMQNGQAGEDLQTDPTLAPDKQAITDVKEPASQAVTKPAQGVDGTAVVSKKSSVAPVTPPVHKVAKKLAKKPAKKPVVKQDSGPNYYYIGIGIFGALAIGGIGWLLWRRRQTEEEMNDNSMFATSSSIFLPDADDDLGVPVLDEKSSYEVGTVGESSFLSEFTPSDFDVFETDQTEVDPTSEADVYLAYGRYQQAEELMRQAITDHPDKDDYKLKLLEIFYTSENGEGFEGFSKELAAEGKNKDLNFWAKVMEMGSELCPDSALFSPEQGETDFTTAEDSSNVDSDEVIQVADASSEESGEDNSDLDFDLSSFSLTDDTSGELSEPVDEAIAEAESDFSLDSESIDFDLSSDEAVDSFSLEDSKELSSSDISSEKVREASPDEEIETIEFNTDDISLEDFDFPTEESTDSVDKLVSLEPEVAVAQTVEELGNSDFDFDFDEISAAPAAGQASDSDDSPEIDLMVSDLTDMDEFETKIDLAKAYIDMGDEAAAKEIVQEVLEKGNDTQKAEAQIIIDKLA